MSSQYVRDKFRQSWYALVPSITLYETINDDPDHDSITGVWATVMFNAFNETPVSLGQPSCRREEGTITVVLSYRAGEGDRVLNAAAESVRNAFRYWDAENITVVQVDPPLASNGFSDGMNYVVDVDITYTYDNYI